MEAAQTALAPNAVFRLSELSDRSPGSAPRAQHARTNTHTQRDARAHVGPRPPAAPGANRGSEGTENEYGTHTRTNTHFPSGVRAEGGSETAAGANKRGGGDDDSDAVVADAVGSSERSPDGTRLVYVGLMMA